MKDQGRDELERHLLNDQRPDAVSVQSSPDTCHGRNKSAADIGCKYLLKFEVPHQNRFQDIADSCQRQCQGEDPNDPDDGRIPQESAQKRGYDHNDQGKDCPEDETEIIDRDKFTCTDILLLYQRRADAVLDKYQGYVEKDRDQCKSTEFFRCKQACQNQ